MSVELGLKAIRPGRTRVDDVTEELCRHQLLYMAPVDMEQGPRPQQAVVGDRQLPAQLVVPHRIGLVGRSGLSKATGIVGTAGPKSLGRLDVEERARCHVV